MKKLNKFFAVLVALAMMATLCVMNAFALDGDNPKTTKTVTISKQLNIAEGLTAPEDTYTFTITPVSVDGVKYDPAAAAGEKGYMPTMTAPTINTIAGKTATDGSIIQNTSFDLTTAGWTHAGVYKYTLTEEQGNVEGTTYNTGDTKTYNFQVVVINKGDGLEVSSVEIDNGTTKLTGDPKENPNAGAEDATTISDVIFENDYTKDAEPTITPSGKSASFYVNKAVDGQYSDKTKEFAFTIAIVYPETGKYDDVKYYENGTELPAGAVVTEGRNATVTVNLKAGDEFYVTGAPIGTKYSVTEDLTTDDAAKKYTESAVVYEGGDQNADKNLAADRADAQGAKTTIEDILVKEKTAETQKNATEVTNKNTKDETDDPNTGILISNLPYIALALVAIGGLVAYVVVRRRQDDEA